MDDEDDASESSRSAGAFTTIPKAAVAINRGEAALASAFRAMRGEQDR